MIHTWIQAVINWDKDYVHNHFSFIPDLIKYYFLCYIEVTVLLTAIDFVIILILFMTIHVNVWWYYKLSGLSINKPRALIKICKIYYDAQKFRFFIHKIRPNLLGMGKKRGNEKPTLYDYLTGSSLLEFICGFVIGMLTPSKRMLLSILMVMFLFYNVSLDWLFKIDFSKLTFDDIDKFTGLLTKIVAIVTTVILLLVTWRNMSVKGKQIRAVNKANQSFLEKVTEIHRELLPIVSSIVYKATKNLETVSRQKSYLLNHYLKNIYPHVSYDNGKIIWKDDFNFFHSKQYTLVQIDELKELETLFAILEKAKEDKQINYLRTFISYDYAMGAFDFSVADKEDMGTTLFAKAELDKLLHKTERSEIIFSDIQQEDKRSLNKLYYENELLTTYKDFEKTLNSIIIEAADTIVQLQKYREACSKLLSLKSSKIGDWLRHFAGKD